MQETRSVSKSCPTLCDRVDRSPPGSSVHSISQARIQEWLAISFSRRSFQTRNQTHVSCISRQILYHWATKEDWCRRQADRHIYMCVCVCTPTQRTRVSVNSGSWRWTGRPGVLLSMESQRVGHDWATGLDWMCIYMPSWAHKLQITSHKISQDLAINCQLSLSEVFHLPSPELKSHLCPNFSLSHIFSSPVISSVIITKKKKKKSPPWLWFYKMPQTQKSRVKSEAFSSHQAPPTPILSQK